MPGIREAKREALKKALIDAATARVVTGGLKELSARSVTTDANCALGSLYTVFDDLDDLIIHMNSKTLHRLGDAIVGASKTPGDDRDPITKLRALARAYVKFASENHALWIALFDYAVLNGTIIPQWHENEQAVLINQIIGPISALNPEMEETKKWLHVRTLFSAVHGMVSLSLEDRYIGIPREELDAELMRFIDQMVAGLNSGK